MVTGRRIVLFAVASFVATILSPQPAAAREAATTGTESAASRSLKAVHDEIASWLITFDIAARQAEGLPLLELRPDSLEVLRVDAARAAAFRARVERIRAAPLSSDDRLTRAYLLRLLDSIAARHELWLYVFPVAPYSGGWVHEGLRRYAAEASLAGPALRGRYLRFLSSYADYVRSQRTKLAVQADAGIRIPKPALPAARRVVDALQAASAALVPDAARLKGAAADARSDFLSRASRIVERDIEPAFAAFRSDLGEDYERRAPASVGLAQYPGGAKIYERLAQVHTGTSLTPAAIHAIGLDMMAEANVELTAIWKQIGFHGTREEFMALINADPRFSAQTPAEVEAFYTSAIERIEPLLSNYFSLLPEAPYGVERAPPQIEAGMTYGYYKAPTPDDPRGLYIYNGSSPAERSFANAPAIIYHELLPGHHFQIALQLENDELPALRRENGFLPRTAYAEGWAEYAADLAGEMGLYRTPYERFGRLVSEMFLANRLVVDTGMNALGWSLDEARAYMRANTFASGDEIESELLRYSTDIPGQALAYAMGHREILRMRRRAETALGARFDIRAFHAAVLSPGALPLDLLDAHLLRWQQAMASSD